MPAVRQIVGPHLLEPAPAEWDMERAADLVVLRARNITIACRIRRYGYAQKYPHEFTIRSQLDSGHRTELEKITNGWGDWMFYGHASEDDEDIDAWFLIDLAAWRAHLIRNRANIECVRKSNGDGTHFVAFDVRSFKGNPKLLIASSHNHD